MSNDTQPIPIEEYLKMKFLKDVPLDGRAIFQTLFYEEGKPYLGIENTDTNKITVLENTIPEWAGYWSDKIIDRDKDLFLPLLDTLAQHFSFSKISHRIRALESDITNFAAVIEKLFAIHTYNVARPQINASISLMYLTELEYFFGLSRSMIDLLHDCYRYLHYEKFKIDLPETFGKFKERMSSSTGANYKIPEGYSSYLSRAMPLFTLIRDIRNSIFHHGKCFDKIYLRGLGPGVNTNDTPFDLLQPMFENDNTFIDNMDTDGVGSLFYIVVSLIDQFIEATNDFSTTIKDVFTPIPDSYVQDGFHYYFRGPSFVLLNRRKELLEKCWLEPARLNITHE